MFWKVVVYAVLCFGFYTSHLYYDSVVRSEITQQIAMRQLEDEDGVPRHVQQLNVFHAILPPLIAGGWCLVTVGFFGGDVRRLMRKMSNIIGENAV